MSRRRADNKSELEILRHKVLEFFVAERRRAHIVNLPYTCTDFKATLTQTAAHNLRNHVLAARCEARRFKKKIRMRRARAKLRKEMKRQGKQDVMNDK